MKDWRKIWNLLRNYIRSWMFIYRFGGCIQTETLIKEFLFFTCYWMLENEHKREMDAAHYGDVYSLSLWAWIESSMKHKNVIIFIQFPSNHHHLHKQIDVLIACSKFAMSFFLCLLSLSRCVCHSLLNMNILCVI